VLQTADIQQSAEVSPKHALGQTLGQTLGQLLAFRKQYASCCIPCFGSFAAITFWDG
jgi:predicted alpha/beta hydrolase